MSAVYVDGEGVSVQAVTYTLVGCAVAVLVGSLHVARQQRTNDAHAREAASAPLAALAGGGEADDAVSCACATDGDVDVRHDANRTDGGVCVSMGDRCTPLTPTTTTTKASEHDAASHVQPFAHFQYGYLIVRACCYYAEFLRGPYSMALYTASNLTLQQRAMVYVLTYVSSLLLGTVVSAAADVLGRVFMCRAFCIVYIVALLTHVFSSSFAMFATGRMLIGVSGLLLSTVFETWMVTHHRACGYTREQLQDTNFKACYLVGAVAVLAGLTAEVAVYATGGRYAAPFACAVPPLVVALYIMRTWRESYGSFDETTHDAALHDKLARDTDDAFVVVNGGGGGKSKTNRTAIVITTTTTTTTTTVPSSNIIATSTATTATTSSSSSSNSSNGGSSISRGRAVGGDAKVLVTDDDSVGVSACKRLNDGCGAATGATLPVSTGAATSFGGGRGGGGCASRFSRCVWSLRALYRIVLIGCRTVARSRRAQLLGACEALYDTAFGLWLFCWTLVLDSTTLQTPYGLVFTVLMLCTMIGSLLTRLRTPPAAIGAAASSSQLTMAAAASLLHTRWQSRLLLGTHVAATVAVILTLLLQRYKVAVLLCLAVFETSMGAYYAQHPMLRAVCIHDEQRAAVTTLFYVPSQLFVPLLLLMRLSPQWLLSIAAALLTASSVCVALLLRHL